jgi:hypothetical protein
VRRALTIALAAVSLAAPAAARANAFDQIFKDYQHTGKVDPCKYSQAQLQQAQGQVPNDVQAYAPDFPNALQSALERRAGGACRSGHPAPAQTTPAAVAPVTTTPAAPAPSGVTTTPAPTPDPAVAPAANDQAIARTAASANGSDAGVPAPVVALAVLGGLLALGGLLYGLAHWLAFDPPWAQRARFAMAEAGWRVGNTWSEFADWLRLGR